MVIFYTVLERLVWQSLSLLIHQENMCLFDFIFTFLSGLRLFFHTKHVIIQNLPY